MPNTDLEELTQALRPLAAAMTHLSLADPEAARTHLTQELALDSDPVLAVRSLVEAGRERGWLLPKEAGGMRFGRVTKDVDGFSVDAVLMSRAGPAHRHPNGEINLLFRTDGDPRFCGHAEGWAVFPPDSVHVPEVTDGEMLILYFLPGGKIEFL